MKHLTDPLTPPKRLAVAYAPAAERVYFGLILEFDVRLAQVAASTNETLIAQMRMAWWRDIITKPAELRPSGEPLLAILNDVEQHDDSYGRNIAHAMLLITDAWDALLAEEQWDAALLLNHAEKRGEAVYGLLERGADNIAAGQLWALHDLANSIGVDIRAAIAAVEAKMPVKTDQIIRSRRHLSLLAIAARRQYDGGGTLGGLRLMLHALTGY